MRVMGILGVGFILMGCSEYDFGAGLGPGSTVDSDLRVDDLAGQSCDGFLSSELVLRNVGDDALTIEDLLIEGNWTADVPPLPYTIGPDQRLTIDVQGSGVGQATVWSDVESMPRVVELSADSGQAPEVTIVHPTADDVLQQAGPMELVAQVDGVADPRQSVVEWFSDLDGPLGTAVPDETGRATLVWDPALHTSGDHVLTAEVTDACGNDDRANVSVCQQGGYAEDSLDIASWHFEGAAYWDTANDWLEVVPALTNQVGSAFQTSSVVTGDNVSIAFDFYIGDGTGADGISLTALDVNRMTTFLGGAGCGIGYGDDPSCTSGPGLPGWSIEVDTWFNDGQDPTPEDHLMFTFDGDIDDGEVWATLPEMEDNGWHTMEVTVIAPRVKVSIDGFTYIDQDIPGYYAFPAYVGFTAGTGGSTNTHLIDSLVVEQLVCDE